MTKVDIYSGFLGAGKTTLIKKLIAEAFSARGEKLVLIENEFGEIGIDGGFLKDSGIEITEMNSGCICCTLVGDFGEALKKVKAQFDPDRILIEPSGVGKLSDVIKAIQDVAEDADIVVNNFIAVVDASKCKMYMKNFGEFFNNQIEYAKTIILSRTQNLKEEKLAEAVKLIREHNDKAVLITTPWDELTGEFILKSMEEKSQFEDELLEAAGICPECGHHHEPGEECGHDHHHLHDHDDNDDEDEHEHHHHHHDHDECGCHDEHGHHHHHHADEVFSSIGIETTHKFTEEEISDILEKLDSSTYGVVLRAKGIIASTEGEWIHFDYTPGEQNVRRGSNDVIGRICVIGSELKEDLVKELFAMK
ncbi:MAG: GTP-binding protein [Lachnospiraceae bacterium]|nr:GTP-binding protein [Lachnospiraceae bacterium]